MESRRFTLEEVREGAAAGWIFSPCRFPFPMSFPAWFRREVPADG